MKYIIGVTATGGGVGQSILKALKNTGYKLVAFDSESTAAGLYMADIHDLIPYASDKDYIPVLLNKCKKHHVDLLFPGMDCELLKLSNARHAFLEEGVRIVVSDHEVLNIADNKELTVDFLKETGLPYPKIYDHKIVFPFVLKPRTGSARSRNTWVINNQSEIPGVDMSNYIMQEYINGDEYTCGTVTLGNKYRGCIVMRRILRDGDTYKAWVERNNVIEELCEKICTKLMPFGAFNIQLKLRNGIPYVFEFNARCSGTTAARALSGFNEPLMIADYLLKQKAPEYEIKELTILRYWNEIVLLNGKKISTT